MDLPEIDKLISEDPKTGCWLFEGPTYRGYGRVHYQGQTWRVHRLAWTLKNGPIPDGKVLDHLCRNRNCCNPDHLEPVTDLVNIHRSPIHNATKTHCKQGHPFTEETTGYNHHKGRVRRYCRKCQRAWNRAAAAKRRAGRKAA